jgi:S-formylglutathione hydrolase
MVDELRDLTGSNVSTDPDWHSIKGHSMGGHGALVLSLRPPGRWLSTALFSLIVAHTKGAWGQKPFRAYLSPNESRWQKHDAVALLESGLEASALLVDVGESDTLLKRAQACPPRNRELGLFRDAQR